MKPCDCGDRHVPRRVVLTGGPGAGKTAVLELIRLFFCEHVKTLPEAAGIVFGGVKSSKGDSRVRILSESVRPAIGPGGSVDLPPAESDRPEKWRSSSLDAGKYAVHDGFVQDRVRQEGLDRWR